jgi:hypothetical protein
MSVLENHRHLTDLDEANLSPCAVNGGSKFISQGQAGMSTEYGAGSYGTFWSSNPIRTRHLADLEDACWFLAMGLSLTTLFCALGYAESIGQALAISG